MYRTKRMIEQFLSIGEGKAMFTKKKDTRFIKDRILYVDVDMIVNGDLSQFVSKMISISQQYPQAHEGNESINTRS